MSLSGTTEQVCRPSLPSVLIARGVSSSGVYKCGHRSGSSEVEVIKQESKQLEFKVSLYYAGIVNDRSFWIHTINNKSLKQGVDESVYRGSLKFEFKPVDAETLEIQETDDESMVRSSWVHLLGALDYQVYKTPPLTREKVENLIAKGIIFKSIDNRKADAILYNRHAGIFLRFGYDVYHAKDTSTFTQCSIKPIRSEFEEPSEDSSEVLFDSKWKVKFQEDTASHTFELRESFTSSGKSFTAGALWDEIPLKIIN